MKVVSEQHRHEPDPGKITRARDGAKGDLLNMFDYPLKSVCHLCGLPIAMLSFYSTRDWEVVNE